MQGVTQCDEAAECASSAVLLLSGLPAAGKTTLAQRMLACAPQHAPDVQVHHICFDDALEGQLCTATTDATSTSQLGEASHNASTSSRFNPELWQASRMESMEHVERCLFSSMSHQAGEEGTEVQQRAHGGRVLVIVDDNMYYRSMRYQVLQLARKCRAAYLQLFIQIPLNQALERNNMRRTQLGSRLESRLDSVVQQSKHESHPDSVEQQCQSKPHRDSEGHFPMASIQYLDVPDASIMRMSALMEEPDGSRFPWESQSLVVKSSDLEQCTGQMLWEWVLKEWGPPAASPPDPAVLEAAKEAARKVTQESILHHVDLSSRKVVAETVARAQKEKRAEVARCVNDARLQLLHMCRQLYGGLSLVVIEEVGRGDDCTIKTKQPERSSAGGGKGNGAGDIDLGDGSSFPSFVCNKIQHMESGERAGGIQDSEEELSQGNVSKLLQLFMKWSLSISG